jgi:hypothetical protein
MPASTPPGEAQGIVGSNAIHKYCERSLDEGGTLPIVIAKLWMLWTAHGTGPGSGNQQLEQDSISVQSAGNFSLSFNLGPSNSSVSKGIGLTIQDANLVPSDTGWWFRSHFNFDESLPSDPIEVVLAAPVVITAAELPGILPPPPFQIDSDTNVTGLTASLAQGGIDFTAIGTTRKTGAAVGFRYTGRLLLLPSSDVAAVESEALSVGISSPAITFLPGPSVPGAIHSILLNIFQLFVMHEIGPKIRTGLERRVNTAVISSVGRSLPGGVLPVGVTLSVRTISITTATISIRGALGAFGGVLAKFPQSSTGSMCLVATVLHGVDSEEVKILRAFRDLYLLNSPIGRRLITLYECVSPRIVVFISRSLFLKSATRVLVVGPAISLARRSLAKRSPGGASRPRR